MRRRAPPRITKSAAGTERRRRPGRAVRHPPPALGRAAAAGRPTHVRLQEPQLLHRLRHEVQEGDPEHQPGRQPLQDPEPPEAHVRVHHHHQPPCAAPRRRQRPPGARAEPAPRPGGGGGAGRRAPGWGLTDGRAGGPHCGEPQATAHELGVHGCPAAGDLRAAAPGRPGPASGAAPAALPAPEPSSKPLTTTAMGVVVAFCGAPEPSAPLSPAVGPPHCPSPRPAAALSTSPAVR